MAPLREPEKVKLFVGMLSAWPAAFAAAEQALVAAAGPVDLRSEVTAHEFTDYYRDEMGHPLRRSFLAFARLIDPGRLAEIKRTTNDLERRMAEGGQWPVPRPINLDPGYVAPAKLVLASGKDYTHRIYLGGGVYAETTLAWINGHWETYRWTYPDFRTPGYQEFLTQVRARLMEQRRNGQK